MSYTRIGYTATASYYHWLVAFPLIGSVASVLQAQNAPKEQKGDLMWRHKSLGLLTGMLVAPRVAYRLLNRDSYHLLPLVGNTPTKNMLGKITHYLPYGFMIIMPATGVAMGYYGGKVKFYSVAYILGTHIVLKASFVSRLLFEGLAVRRHYFCWGCTSE